MLDVPQSPRPMLGSLTMISHGSCICELKRWFPEAGWFSPFLDSVLMMISRRVPFCFWNSQMPSYTKWRQRYCILFARKRYTVYVNHHAYAVITRYKCIIFVVIINRV